MKRIHKRMVGGAWDSLDLNVAQPVRMTVGIFGKSHGTSIWNHDFLYINQNTNIYYI